MNPSYLSILINRETLIEPKNYSILGKRLLFTAVCMAIFTGPIAFGLADHLPERSQILETGSPRSSFEVSTIKPSSATERRPLIIWGPVIFTATNEPLRELVKFAYGVKTDPELITDLKWVDTKRFDIEGKIEDSRIEELRKLPVDQRLAQWQLMVQSLLSDRFKLKVTSQSRKLPVYALVIAKNGPKLTKVGDFHSSDGKTVAPPPPGTVLPPGSHLPSMKTSRGRVKAEAISMSVFSDWISRQSETDDRIVQDSTGLEGTYDFSLQWMPSATPSTPNGADNQATTNILPLDVDAPSFNTALREQLGLELKSTKADVKVLVIEHIEPPSEN
jgi:uncharacterized protein (TIGR03435 family)